MTAGAQVPAVILAGGKSRRFGRQKTVGLLSGETLLQRVLVRLEPQTSAIALSIGENEAPPGFDELPMLPDIIGPAFGPLAGIHASLSWAKDNVGSEFVLTVPVDAPFLPEDLAVRLMEAVLAQESPGAVALGGGRSHPLHGLWHVDLLARLQESIEGGMRSANAWVESQALPGVTWAVIPFDPFFNINTPADLAEAERALEAAENSRSDLNRE